MALAVAIVYAVVMWSIAVCMWRDPLLRQLEKRAAKRLERDRQHAFEQQEALAEWLRKTDPNKTGR